MTKKYLGTFGVDSGQVMLVDPCYVKDFESNEFNLEKRIILKIVFHTMGLVIKLVLLMLWVEV